MTKFKIEDTLFFKIVFRGITKFTNTANFEITKHGIRIRSVDPHDFCYVDIRLSPAFFKEFSWSTEKFSASADIGRFKRIISNITKDKSLYLEIKENHIGLSFVNGSTTRYTLDWLDENIGNLPESLKLKYPHEVTVSAKELQNIIKEASGVSRDICFELKDSKLSISSSDEGFSFSKDISLQGQHLGRMVHEKSFTIIDYLQILSEIISVCENVTLGIKEDLPLRLELSYKGKGSFTFIVANRKLTESEKVHREKTELKQNSPFLATPSLPQISVIKFPKFIKSIDIKNGISVGDLKKTKYETANSTYTRLAELIGFITRKNNRFYLTKAGEDFVKVLDSGSSLLKPKLNKHLAKTVPEYSTILNFLSNSPMAPEDLFEKLLHGKKSNSIISDKDDIMLLLGIATWCNAIERRLGVYYFSR